MKADSLLFKVVIERSKIELEVNFIAAAVARTSRCVHDLLALAGYHGMLSEELGKEGRDWLLSFKVHQGLTEQLDLLQERPRVLTAAQTAEKVIEFAVVALARFHREVQPVVANRLHDALKELKSTDPRIIATLARQPGGVLTLRQDAGELELRIQTQSHRSLSTEPEKLFGYVVSVGFGEMSVVPLNRRSRTRVCIHPVRVRIPRSLRDRFDPFAVLRDFVKEPKKMVLEVRSELVVRKRQHVTYELVSWPPALADQVG